MIKRYFSISILVSLLGLVAVYVIYQRLDVLCYALALAVLEVSISFDNAIVNAKVLKTMSKVWQRRFLTWGILIAVFGMRLMFPVLLVSIGGGIGPLAALHLAMDNPAEYQVILEQGYPWIAGFGGAFLMMVFFAFLAEHQQRSYHWCNLIENNVLIKLMAKLPFAYALIPLGLGFLMNAWFESAGFLKAYLWGMGVHGVFYLFHLFSHRQLKVSKVASHGFLAFCYLECLDASFSFDGVVGAFAITKEIWVIMIGLGIGAMFVRSLTIYFVDHKIMDRFPYIEHGAFYAIGFLALVLLLKIAYHVPEWITVLVSLGLIGLALWHSIRSNHAEKTGR